MKPLPKVPGKPPNVMNIDSVIVGCMKYRLRIIIYYADDGYIINIRDMESGNKEDYYVWGDKLKINHTILIKVKKDLSQR